MSRCLQRQEPVMTNKLGKPVGCHYLVTSLTFYYSTVTDLTLSRSVHATELEPCCPDPFLLSSSECHAVHYGQCSSLLKLPTFSIGPPNCTAEAIDAKPSSTQSPSAKKVWPCPSLNKASATTGADSPATEGCSSLELLAANIEKNLKPFLNILSSCDSTEAANSTSAPNSTEDENIGSLATSLQYHLGNFIAAVRQQQQLESNEQRGSGQSSQPAELLQKKNDFSTKTPPHKTEAYINQDASALNNWSTNDVLKPSATGVNYKDLIGDGKNSVSVDRVQNRIFNRDSSDAKQQYLYNSEASSEKQREVMRILNRKEPAKEAKNSQSTDSVDSELLDSLISLMNVSLVDLEDSPSKKSHHQRGKSLDPCPKPVEVFGPRFSLEDFTLKEQKENMRHPPCRRKLVFDAEGRAESADISASSKSDGGSVPNGLVDAVPIEALNRGEWKSISALHRRDSLIPTLPSPLNDKRPYVASRYSNTTEHGNLASVAKSSVAERVLAFERCPDWNTDRSSSVKEFNRKANKDREFFPVLPKKVRNSSLTPFTENSAVQFVKKPKEIPKFYFPNGQPPSSEDAAAQLDRLKSTFAGSKGKFTCEGFHVVTKACALPLYWKMPLYLAVGTDKMNNVTTSRFLEFWKRMTSSNHDEASRFVYILSRGKHPYLLPEDFRPMIQDIVDTHPGLTFLRESKEFHSRYVDTVISRIFYDVNRSWSGKITALELRKSSFFQAVTELEEDDDINQMTDYFSYEHFYVIYCKFWKIDTDHDLLIDKGDLQRHNSGDICSRMIDRIFSGAVSREMLKTGHMRYTDFVWFLLAEEDKRHPRSIEYWFRCMDLNGDGFLSMYELEYFYKEQMLRLEAVGIEAMPFNDCLCQMLDMVRPKSPDKISLSDLKRCRLTSLFFDTFFNLGKYLEHEQRDPFSSVKVGDGQMPEISDWCRYAEDEYNHLISEENYGYSDRYNSSGQYYCADNAAFTRPEFASKVYNRTPEKDDDDDYADSDADY